MGEELTKAQREALAEFAASADHGAFACTSDGMQRADVSALEKRGFLDWKGTNWGANFWAITPAGRKALETADDH